MKDFLGREIRAGSRIVWPGRQGSSLWMSVGVVEDIVHRDELSGPKAVLKVRVEKVGLSFGKSGNLVTIECLDRIVVVD